MRLGSVEEGGGVVLEAEGAESGGEVVAGAEAVAEGEVDG